MNVIFRLKPLVFHLFFIALVVFAIEYSEHIWTQYFTAVKSTALILTGIAIILAVQFNHSRLGWLSLVLALYAINQDYQFLALSLAQQQVFLLLFLACIAFVADRGVYSIHTLYRVALVAALYGASFFYPALLSYLGTVPPLPMIVLAALVFTLLIVRTALSPNHSHMAFVSLLVVLVLQEMHFVQLERYSLLLVSSVYFVVVILIESYLLAYRDELTKIPTRRALKQLSLALGNKYTLAMLDIDHFKKFNDTYGHDIGDQVLKLVATQLTKVRAGGKCFRYGGEEFTVVFPGKDKEIAIAELERLRQAIQDYKMVIRQPVRKSKDARGKAKTKQKTVSITISIGVCQKGAKQTFDQVMKVADEALYRAKKKGRNKVSE
ncbi:GGDEF domain-containing protein [Thalassotalea agarivorans]|uniref:diguanylate cyclase n=1 Tax=Thalassotalea agarivorans TaxID=349064 RepID=A0A1I0DFA0_THASX|nr:GGDEF domain-containing protein [Thalassotalea agarivorans]SET31076.1 diguanylate cyclase (GGDEF) domain-containing protein [Thalassotalea agarivorans]